MSWESSKRFEIQGFVKIIMEPGSKVEEHSDHNPRSEGSNPDTSPNGLYYKT